ncbi:MAG: PASTA domain-containing protein [Eggerthellaceae bacterium]|nr:PASTA domain-containing protein [Eggerthellaceae bacterium]
MKKAVIIACVFLMSLALMSCGGNAAKSRAEASSAASSSVIAASDSASETGSAGASSGSTELASNQGVVVPDFIGKNLGDVSDELKSFDVDYYKEDGSHANVFKKSNWRIDAQSLEAGATVQKGARLELTLGHITEEKAAAEKADAEARKAEERANLDYTTVSVAQLVDDLDANALNAKETYKGGYYRISGVVSNIDASGKYIDLDPEGVWYNFTMVQCYLNDDASRDYVRQISTGDYVTLCGQITDVGEVMGYSVDVYFFE